MRIYEGFVLGSILSSVQAASWLAALNTNVSVVVTGGNARLRLRTAFTVSGATGGTAFKWQYAKNGGAWTDLTASSSNVRTFTSAYYADGDDVPQAISGGSYVANNNGAEEAAGDFTLGVAIAAGEHAESEVALEVVSADVANNDTLDFRIVLSDGTAFSTYSQVGRITVVK